MAGINPVAKFAQTNFATAADVSSYKGQIDSNSAVMARFCDNFAPRALDTPAMKIHLDAGHFYNGLSLDEVAAQDSGTITAPASNPRIDRAVVDIGTGAISIITGTEAGSPVAPAIPLGKLPVAQILLATSTTTITNSLITDERDFIQSNARIVLTGNLSLFVSSSGNDSNNGLSSTTAWLTIQHAVDFALLYLDSAGFTVTINVADATYTGAISVTRALVGGGLLQFTGNTTTPANCIISTTSATAISLSGGAYCGFKGFKLKTTTSGYTVHVDKASSCYFTGNMEFNTLGAGFSHIFAENNSYVEIQNSYTVSGGGGNHWAILSGAIISCNSVTVTVSGTPAWTQAFVTAAYGVYVQAHAITFSGSATGPRYAVSANSVIDTNGGGANYFPGNSAGASTTGGQYI